MGKNKNYLLLKKFFRQQGIDLFGVADIGGIKKDFLISQNLLEKFNKAVCLGLRLSASILEEIEGAPTKLYFHHYRAVNNFLDQVALRASIYIQKKGYLSISIPASQIVDWQDQKAHLSHKQIGYLAGLGWIGRNNLLVNKNFGSQFRLTSILTNMPLRTDRPTKDDCQDCRFCIDVCPSGAIKEERLEFDHLKCFDKLKEFQRQRVVGQYICGVCLKACMGRRT